MPLRVRDDMSIAKPHIQELTMMINGMITVGLFMLVSPFLSFPVPCPVHLTSLISSLLRSANTLTKKTYCICSLAELSPLLVSPDPVSGLFLGGGFFRFYGSDFYVPGFLLFSVPRRRRSFHATL